MRPLACDSGPAAYRRRAALSARGAAPFPNSGGQVYSGRPFFSPLSHQQRRAMLPLPRFNGIGSAASKIKLGG
jgi:hypothetical protein